MGAGLAARAVGRPRSACQGGKGEPALPKGHRHDARGVGSGTGLAEAVRSASVPCEALPRGEPRPPTRTLPGESPGDVHRSSLLALLQVLLALLALVLVLVLAL